MRVIIICIVAFLALGGLITASVLIVRENYATVDSQDRIAIGGPFQLVDDRGKATTDHDLQGKWSLVYFGYTHCPDACPTALSNIGGALTKLGDLATKVVPVFITVDPARDTVPVMHEYVKSFGSSFLGLTGTQAQIDAAAHEYRVYVSRHNDKNGDYDMDHSSIIYVMDPDGKFVTNFTQEDTAPKIVERLKPLLQAP